MICPKCKSENQFGNFCSECGNRLKEKCPECGKMEPIGRKVCETKLGKASQELSKYLSKNGVRGVYSRIVLEGRIKTTLFILVMAIEFLIIAMLPIQYIILHINLICFGFIVFIVIIAIFIIRPIMGRVREKLDERERRVEQNFLQENPGYAEILRKAEKT